MFSVKILKILFKKSGLCTSTIKIPSSELLQLTYEIFGEFVK